MHRATYRISEKRVFDEPRILSSSSGYLHSRPKVHTFSTPYALPKNPAISKSHQFSRVKSSSILKAKTPGNTSLASRAGPAKSKFQGQSGSMSLSNKIKANLIKTKNKTSTLSLIKRHKNKTILHKKPLDRSFLKSRTIKDQKHRLIRQNTSKMFSRQNSGATSKPFQFRKEAKFGRTLTLEKFKSKYKKSEANSLTKDNDADREKVKHIGDIQPEEQVPEPIVNAIRQSDQKERAESSKNIDNSTVIHQVSYSNQDTRTDTFERQSELRSLPRNSQDRVFANPQEVFLESDNFLESKVLESNQEIKFAKEEKTVPEFEVPESQEDPDISLNPFVRKPESKLEIKLPDLGVVSSEKEKEKQSNLTDRSVDQFLNRRKTKFSKEVSQFIAENEDLEPRTPVKSSVQKKRKKIIKMRWRNSLKAYVQVVEYEDVEEPRQYDTPRESQNQVFTPNQVEAKGEKQELNINRLKKFVNTPKNIKTQFPHDGNSPSLQMSSSTKKLAKDNVFNFKKSHSTYDLQSSTNDDTNPKNNILPKEGSEPQPPSSERKVNRGFQRKHTTFYEEKARHYRPIYENFGDCPANEYRLIIYKMDKNSKTDKIFFNNPTNYTFPEKLLVFDTKSTRDSGNLSFQLVANLKCSREDKKTVVSASSRYKDLSSVVNMGKTLKPSNYHDLKMLETDFSFPEDKPKSPKKPTFFKLSNGAEQIDEFTYRIGGIEFKDYRGKSNTKSASNMLAGARASQPRTFVSNQLSKKEAQHKSYTFLPARTATHESSNSRSRGLTTPGNLSSSVLAPYGTRNPEDWNLTQNYSTVQNLGNGPR